MLLGRNEAADTTDFYLQLCSIVTGDFLLCMCLDLTPGAVSAAK